MLKLEETNHFYLKTTNKSNLKEFENWIEFKSSKEFINANLLFSFDIHKIASSTEYVLILFYFQIDTSVICIEIHNIIKNDLIEINQFLTLRKNTLLKKWENIDDEDKTSKHICSICGKHYEGSGNNSQPINDGKCCDNCNNSIVIPIRLVRS